MIAREVSKVELMDQAIKEGFQNMFANGINKAAEGITTFDEILKVAKA
jgi:general secretion pathway protein E